MNTTPYVSVLIDTYNHENFIERAITSVLEQDFPMGNVEVIVVDDGSSDRTPDIVRRFEPHVRLICKANGGQASAFNAGIRECRGKIVAFLDGDDWWAPQKLRYVVEGMDRDPEVGIIGNGITEVFENGDQHSEVLHTTSRFRINSLEGAHIFRRRKSQLGTSRMSLRAEILRKIMPVPNEIVIEADEYIFTLAATLSDVSILEQPLTFYRIHAGNLFQLSEFSKASMLRKQKSLAILAQKVSERLFQFGLSRVVVMAVADTIQIESDLIRLQLDGGSSWEMVSTEWKFYRIVHEDASMTHIAFKLGTLALALLFPPSLYYKIKRRLQANRLYLRARTIFFPVPQPLHFRRSRRKAS